MACNARPKLQPDCSRAAQASSSVNAAGSFSNASTFFGSRACFSKARTAGRVPVIFTQKKYVRKPRGAKPGTVHVEREKILMVRPVEPPRERMADVVEIE